MSKSDAERSSADTRRARRLMRQRVRRTVAAGTGAALVLVAGGGVVAQGLWGTGSAAQNIGLTASTVPAGDAVFACAPMPRLVEGTTAEGTDPEFAPDAESAESTVSGTVISDPAQRIPGTAIESLDGESLEDLAERLPDDEADQQLGASEDGYSGQTAESASEVSSSGWALLRAQPLGGLKSTAGLTRHYEATDGDLAGQATAACLPPSNDQWITGASTEVGRTAVLMLSNPSDSAATVDLDVLGSTGRAEAANLRGIVVGPGQTKDIVLAGFIADDPAVSVRVRSQGAPLAAVVQQSVLRGLTPGGVDYLTPGAPAARSQLVPGLFVQQDSLELSTAGDFSDATSQLQVANPSSQEAQVSLRIFGEDGEVDVPGGAERTVPADSVAQFSLEELENGNYTVALQSSESVIAGARSVRGTSDANVDFGWMPATSRLGHQHLVAMPGRDDADLMLGSAGGTSSVDLRPVSADGTIGDAETIELTGAATEMVDLESVSSSAVAFLLDASGEAVYGGLRVLGEDERTVSMTPLPPASEGRRSIEVDVRR
ncbi:DUF5719 family protein [Zhihengliuella flava]|uniref:Secreted protein n=1 Tax=Zhihengliuella flava TaxID=1285193 RepID=A0A931GE09_9MICC|nr:DUF5719 family protein [Zhihengliuella flava]MBG6083973.1 hypothetical protein [Zhihengliuella flava]